MSTTEAYAVLDVIAEALTPALLMPFPVPQRPFLLGTAGTFFIRAGYMTRQAERMRPAGALHSAIGPEAPEALPPALQQLVQAVATALHAEVQVDVDWSRPECIAIEKAAAAASLIVCHDALQRAIDPTPMLTRLRQILEDAPAALLSVPLRALSPDADDLGPPAAPAHVREWTFPELQALLDSAGLDAALGGIVPDSSVPRSAQSSRSSDAGSGAASRPQTAVIVLLGRSRTPAAR